MKKWWKIYDSLSKKFNSCYLIHNCCHLNVHIIYLSNYYGWLCSELFYILNIYLYCFLHGRSVGVHGINKHIANLGIVNKKYKREKMSETGILSWCEDVWDSELMRGRGALDWISAWQHSPELQWAWKGVKTVTYKLVEVAILYCTDGGKDRVYGLGYRRKHLLLDS